MIVYEPEALGDLERIFEFNLARDPPTAADHIARIRQAIRILDQLPNIGRRLPGSPTRELIISHGSSGYIAMYEANAGLIRVFAIRHQREAGYRGD